ncbi:hypothetical protein SEA_GUUELAD_133 [Mycobacterium phage GuuelaD]|uniref:Uncharacterized protein n=1 Tax=Mycobacterium phage GuuelaD TaxID=2015819 RepID=A0A286MQN1_9CAUD|nr:hypothetical protein J4T97_gp108 [Mycobacterium phage GuuelaD]ASW31556.1 hypothetical protein SEA_GUUELAD_133 [Mycobacterium phage GuuelaD]
MGGRGGGGTGGGKGGNKGGDSDLTVDKRPAVDAAAEKHSDPNAAADALGLTGSDKDHFVNGANAEGRRIPRIGRDESKIIKPADAAKLIAAHKAAVIAYERKYGRGAAQAYSRGAYWSLVRFIKTVMAVSATATQAGSAPALAAVNAAMLAAYWVDRAKR